MADDAEVDEYVPTSRNRDAGLHGLRKPVFVLQKPNKANPPLDGQITQIARWRYDIDRLEFFPPARFRNAEKQKVPRKNLRLPTRTYTNPHEKQSGVTHLLSPSSIWGTRHEIAALFSDKQLLQKATSKGTRDLSLFYDGSELRIFMDLASKVIPQPDPLSADTDLPADQAMRVLAVDHLKDSQRLPEYREQGKLRMLFDKYEFAIKRAAYVATQQLHLLQLRFLKTLAKALDEDSNQNMSISALLTPPEEPSTPEQSDKDDIEELLDEADDL